MAESAIVTGKPTLELVENRQSQHLVELLGNRRSIRRLRGGSFSEQTRERIEQAIRLTPAAYAVPSWHVVLVHEERHALWNVVEQAFRDRLEGDRLERYLDRLAGFRPGVAVALIYEDIQALNELKEAWQISEETARAFSEQGIGMVQLAIWLTLTEEGLSTSLQHWEWLIEDRLAEFLRISGRYRLAAAMPIGYADEPPRDIERAPAQRVVSRNRFTGER
jgi:predicted oxidoreductase (fatty acid repression mutant protein)